MERHRPGGNNEITSVLPPRARPRIHIPMANHNIIIVAVARSQDFQVVVEMRAAKSLVASRKSNSIAPSRTREAGQSTIKLPCLLE